MTICIAAVCEGRDGKPWIILCFDKRLDEAEWGASDAGLKSLPLAYNWAGLMAGHWATVKELASALRDSMRTGGCPLNKAELCTRISDAASEFAASVLCDKSATCELLLTGFIGLDPALLHIRLHKARVKVSLVYDCFAIGSGAYPAQLMLKHRSYNHVRNIDEACYAVYEAKRFSEVMSSVGPATVMVVQRHCENALENEIRASRIDEKAIDKLEELRKQLCLRPTGGVEVFPYSYFGR